MNQKIIALVAISCFLSVTVCDNGISWRDLYDWATVNLTPQTPAQYTIVITAGLARGTYTMHHVWERCHSHSSYYVDALNCHHAVYTAVLEWAVGLYTLGKISGWYKRDEASINSHIPVNIGGVNGFLLDVSIKDDMGGLKRRDTKLNFNVNGTTYVYEPFMGDDLYSGNVDLVLLTNHNNTDQFPITMLEANHNGTWLLNFLEHNTLAKRDGLDGDQYIQGAGGLVVECQYGAGVQADYWQVDKWVGDMTAKQGIEDQLSATYNVFHGYIGSDSRLKCATKLYSTQQDMSQWRSWDDVWRAF